MSISTAAGCGAHCGITAGREGHCDCRKCHDGQAPVVTLRELTTKIPRIPMCARWYEQAGDYRPWFARAEGCTCGMTAHALPHMHGKHCPVYRRCRSAQLDRIEHGS